MKKVGIITITRGSNYGNKLQNFAMQELIKSFGFESYTIINDTKVGSSINPFDSIDRGKNLLYYLNAIKIKANNKFYRNDESNCIRHMLWYFKNNKKIIELLQNRQNKFDMFFDSYIKVYKDPINIDTINEKKASLNNYFEFFVCGSDQIWNPFYPETSDIDFLTFANTNKRIAISPSIGINSLPKNKVDEYQRRLKGFKKLSIREEQGANILRELINKEVPVLFDPTLLVDRNVWSKIEKKVILEGDYILVYFLGKLTNKYKKLINNYSKKYNFKIIILNNLKNMEFYDIDPGEFLFLIKNAKFIFTDSFHGCIFSLIYQKEFFVLKRMEKGNSMHSRIDTLLKTTQLEERLYNQENKIKPIDYKYVWKCIDKKREMQLNILKSYFDLKGEEG